jgi:hypothetical protein
LRATVRRWYLVGCELACDLAEASAGGVFGSDAVDAIGRDRDRRPGVARDNACARAGRRCSVSNRCSSSTGIKRVPHGIATVSINGSTRRLNVERLTLSASAACVRV